MNIEVFNSVGGAAFFQGMLNGWRHAGARVTAHEAVSEHDYRRKHGAAGRLALRWRMYGGYGWQCWSAARQRGTETDVRVVTTNPFFAPALVTRAGGGRVPVVNLLYDLYPEALVQAGQISADSWIARRCAAVTRYSLRSCAATVFLGDHLRKCAEQAHGKARRAVVIPVGAEGSPFRDSPPLPVPSTEPLRILYAGQFGRMHDTDTLLAAWQAGGCMQGLHWVFHASGAGYARLRRQAGEVPGTEWGGALSDADWGAEMKRAQIAFVTMAPGAERIVMPSKTYSALVAGQAVLAICPRQSDLAALVRKHDCGWVVEPGDAEGLGALLARLVTARSEVWLKRQRAYEAGHRHYDAGQVAKQWMNLFGELAAGPPPITVPLTRHEALV